MLEILILRQLCRRIGQIAREKGRKAGGYQFMLVMLWFAGELGAAFVTAIILFIIHDEEWEQYLFLTYIAAVVGAALMSWLGFQIVKSLPSVKVEEEFEDDYEDS